MTCRLLEPDERTMAEVSEHLRKGECVALPSETVYGLAANALDENAARKIFEIKGRPLIDPLIVHVLDSDHVKSVAVPNDAATKLMEAFWPGPLTLVLPRTTAVPDLVTSGLETVAVRSPAHPLFRRVLEESGLSLAAPSANPFGYISPTHAQHVLDHLGDRLAMVLNGGACQHGVESTIVDVSQESVAILRPGPISPEELSDCLGLPVVLKSQFVPHEEKAMKAAGNLARHYSPKKTCRMVREFSSVDQLARVWLKRPPSHLIHNPGDHFWLSESGSPLEMLKNLYHLLHLLDDDGDHTGIEIEEPLKTDGVWVTLRDRLKRACG